LPQAGSWNLNLITAERASDTLEPHVRDGLGLQVLGMITLTASLSAAVVQRGDTAQHWLGDRDSSA